MQLAKEEDVEKGEIPKDEILAFSDLIKISVDNQNYYALAGGMIPVVEDAFVRGKDQDNCEFYICDLTDTYYTKITDENKLYFFFRLFWNPTKVERREPTIYEMFESTADITETFYYRHDFKLFYMFRKGDELIDDPENINGLTMLCMDWHNDKSQRALQVDDFEMYKIDTLKDIWNMEDDLKGIPPKYDDTKLTADALTKRSKADRRQLCESFTSDELNLFGQKIPVDKSVEAEKRWMLSPPLPLLWALPLA